MEKTIGRPGSWLLNREAPDATEVRVRDDVLEENEIPWHRGMTFEVTCEAPTIDDAIEAARGEAEATGILMAAAARAPIGPARPVLAVDVTPGIEERPCQDSPEFPGSAQGNSPPLLRGVRAGS